MSAITTLLKMARKEDTTQAERDELEAWLVAKDFTEDRVDGIFKGQAQLVDLSQMTRNFGSMASGEIAFGTGNPNNSPSDFTGVAIAFPGYTIGSKTYYIIGQDGGVLKFGLASDGTAYFLSGSATIGEDGITLDQNVLGYIQNITSGSESRVGRVGAKTVNGQSVPGFGMEYYKPASGAELLTNPTLDSNLTSWTATNMVWDAGPQYGQTGLAIYDGSGSGLSLTQNVAATAGLFYYLDVSLFVGTSGTGSTIYLRFFDGSSNILLTEYIAIRAESPLGFSSFSGFATAPTGTASVTVNIESSETDFMINSASLKAVSFANHIVFHSVDADIVTLAEDKGVARIPRTHGVIFSHMNGNPTATAAAGGSLSASTAYYYKLYPRDGSGVAGGGANANIQPTCNTSTTVANKTINLTNITYPPGVTSFDIYRSEGGPPVAYLYLDNVTGATYADNGSITPTPGDLAPYGNGTSHNPFIQPFFDVMADMEIQIAGTGRTYNANVVTHPFDMYYAATAANSNDGDAAHYGVYLYAGTYTIHILGIKGNVCGIINWYLDDALIASNQDWYNAAASLVNQTQSISNVTVTNSGYHVIRWLVNGKNASSGDYMILLTRIRFVPAAY